MGLFNTITIRTPESVAIDFTLAGIGSRALALIVDYVVLGLVELVLIISWSITMVQMIEAGNNLSFDSSSLQLWITAIIGVLAFALYIGYFVGFETWWHGQTPGKRYAKIRVICDNGQPERLLPATLRALMRPVDDMLFLGFFCILISPREKRVGDWLAGTLVVQTDPNPSGQGWQIPERSELIGQDLLNLIEFDAITPDTFATVRDYLQRRSSMTTKARAEVSLHLARHCKTLGNLETLPTEMTADTFLEALYWAYQRRYDQPGPSPASPPATGQEADTRADSDQFDRNRP